MLQFRYFLAVLFIVFSTFSCKEEFELLEGGEFFLKLSQPVTLIDGTVLELISIEDSRCPEGVECIWEGRAAVVVSWKRDESFEFQLNDVEYLNAEVDQYLVSFIELTPYPTQQNQQAQKIARIKIELN